MIKGVCGEDIGELTKWAGGIRKGCLVKEGSLEAKEAENRTVLLQRENES